VTGTGGPDRDGRVSLLDAFLLLASRPECIHNLNGPCRECERGLNLAEARLWREELRALGIEPDTGESGEVE
jgi:hypothetical protein